MKDIDWIKEGLEQPGKSQRGLAKALKLDPSAVNRLLKGERQIKARELPIIQRYLGTGMDEDQAEEPETEIVRVAAYDLRLSAGHGALISNDEAPAFYEPFRLDKLRRVTRAPMDHLALVIVAGDSMSPTLENGDQALVDRTQSIAKDGIYALRIFGDELVVKRLTVQPFGKHLLTISSDNPKHRTYENVDPDEVQIIGRVIWIGREI